MTRALPVFLVALQVACTLAGWLTARAVTARGGSPVVSAVFALLVEGALVLAASSRLVAGLQAVAAALRSLARGEGFTPVKHAWPLGELAATLNAFADPARSPEAVRDAWLQHAKEAAAQEERNRLARDLHDSVKQQIFAIDASAAALALRAAGSDILAGEVGAIRASAREAMTELEAMLQHLRPNPLEKAGLRSAMQTQCEALQYRTGAAVDLAIADLPEAGRLPVGTETALFRIAQEALANIARHAGARRVAVSLGVCASSRPAAVVLTVEDDGRGFDPASGEVRGMGLDSMRQRASRLGGAFDLTSGAGHGTRIRVMVPLLAEGGEPAGEAGLAGQALRSARRWGVAAMGLLALGGRVPLNAGWLATDLLVGAAAAAVVGVVRLWMGSRAITDLSLVRGTLSSEVFALRRLRAQVVLMVTAVGACSTPLVARAWLGDLAYDSLPYDFLTGALAVAALGAIVTLHRVLRAEQKALAPSAFAQVTASLWEQAARGLGLAFLSLLLPATLIRDTGSLAVALAFVAYFAYIDAAWYRPAGTE